MGFALTSFPAPRYSRQRTVSPTLVDSQSQLSVTQHAASMGTEEPHPQASALKQARPATSLCVREVSRGDSSTALAQRCLSNPQRTLSQQQISHWEIPCFDIK